MLFTKNVLKNFKLKERMDEKMFFFHPTVLRPQQRFRVNTLKTYSTVHDRLNCGIRFLILLPHWQRCWPIFPTATLDGQQRYVFLVSVVGSNSVLVLYCGAVGLRSSV